MEFTLLILLYLFLLRLSGLQGKAFGWAIVITLFVLWLMGKNS